MKYNSFMRLYKDYKEDEQKKKQLEEDRRSIGLDEGSAIIYEHGKAAEITRMICSILGLFFILAAAAAAAYLLICGFGG